LVAARSGGATSEALRRSRRFQRGAVGSLAIVKLGLWGEEGLVLGIVAESGGLSGWGAFSGDGARRV
jgi:hypothetical protein